mmetsp:Transcript_42774/g.100271  ORF Transcript_42774/g.100271 Transcript_42774/m.100271 type:complete len:530 (-) Transcript_42774:237-1826(-)
MKETDPQLNGGGWKGQSKLDASQVSTHLDSTAATATLSGSLDTPSCILRGVTAWELLQECETEDEGVVFAGPQSDPEDSDIWDYRGLEACGIPRPDEERRAWRRAQQAKQAAAAALAAERNGTAPPKTEAAPKSEAPNPAPAPSSRPRREPLILPRGDVPGDGQKFICIFQVGLEDDDEFCLVKRILGKGGNNMRAIADSCNAKVRLRGLGSGFLEGADGKEANMPLQLNVSCVDFETYQMAVDRVAYLLRDLYKHYRKYIRSKGLTPPELKVNLEEVRRDDQGLNMLTEKANRSSSQRERDRKAREAERRQVRENMFYKERAMLASANLKAMDDSDLSPDSDVDGGRMVGSNDEGEDESGEQSGKAQMLPGGIPMPTTAAGRRAAARVGGAAAAARASAAAREVERQQKLLEKEEAMRQREQDRLERDRRREAADRSWDWDRSKGGGWSSSKWNSWSSKTSWSNAPVGMSSDTWANWNKGREARGGRYSYEEAPEPPPPPPPPESWDDDKEGSSAHNSEVWGRWRKKE